MLYNEIQIGETYLIDSTNHIGTVRFGLGDGKYRQIVAVREWKEIHNTPVKVARKPEAGRLGINHGNVEAHFLSESSKIFSISVKILKIMPADSKCQCPISNIMLSGCQCGGI